MLLALDIGNTNIKSGIFSDKKLIQVNHFAITEDERFLNEIFSEFPKIEVVAICDVAGKLDLLKFGFLQQKISVFEINDQTGFFFKNNYQTPETLGKDRLAAVAGGIVKFPDIPLLIIDAGTAITFDFVSPTQAYLGGNISPGINLRLKALNSFTEKLPLIEKKENFPKIGKSTNDAILSGVIGGIIEEVKGIISSFRQQNPDSKVIFTGGDAKFLHRFIKNDIFVLPNLVLEGIYELYKFNRK